MAYNITGVEEFDHKRTKVTLDYGEVAFLLYKGECRRFGIGENPSLSDDEYAAIRDEILIPRAKKRVLYYMKNADKTRGQIQRKLKEGFYPDEVIAAVMEFLDHYGFANDQTYAESYIEELRGSYSRREIEAKLMQRGLKPQDVRLALESLTEDDELSACRKALRKKYPGRPTGSAAGRAAFTPSKHTSGQVEFITSESATAWDTDNDTYGAEDPDYSDTNGGLSPEERQKAYAYLARKGFSSAAIREALDATDLQDAFD